MKWIISLYLVSFMYFSSFAQFQNVTGTAQKDISSGKFRWNFSSNGILYPATLEDVNFNGNRPITLNIPGFIGLNPGGNNLADFLNNLFYPSQLPTASITGGIQLERSATGTTPVTVTWTAGRQAATEPLSTIVVDGMSKGFSQPGPGSSVSATNGITLTNNTDKTVTIVVTTTDAKTASASTSYVWLPKAYWGRTANTTATSSDILASAGGSNILTNSKARTITVTASGFNHVFYAYPSSMGDLTSINIGGLESIASFTKTVISFTNASGYTQNYNVYTSNNETSGNVTAIAN